MKDSDVLVWVRAGGRCVICKKYLLDDDLGEVVKIGEVAHIVGREKSQRSPRGMSAMPLDERDEPANLVLLCRGDHFIADRRQLEPLFTVDKLLELKRQHEAQVKHLTGMVGEQTTVAVRIIGDVRGDAVEVDKQAVAAATVHDGRFPYYELDFDNRGAEVDLRHLPAEGTAMYWDAGRAKIDQEMERLRQAVRGEHVAHVSVFGFARLPLLVYFGAVLDDTTPVAVYQRHRETGLWVWADDGPVATFEVTSAPPSEVAAVDEAVLVVNVSGTIQPDELPEEVRGLPTYEIHADEGVRHVDVMRRVESLAAFERTVRALFATWERTAKHLRRVHLFAAVPVAAAVTLGRVLDPQVNPRWVVYDRQDSGGYDVALETP